MAKAGSVKDKSWGGLGGNNAMHSWSGTGKQEPGQTSQMGSGSKRGIAPHAGGQVAYVSDNAKRGREMNQKHGTNECFAGTQTPGQSASCPTGGDKNSFAKGGSTSMFGNRGSRRAEPGSSSPQ
jgi:hypothetical protein